MEAADAVAVVYARAPRWGEVKTRLAAEIGAAAALHAYRRMVLQVIGEVRRLDRVAKEVHFTPADAGEELKTWLGSDLIYRPQVNGGLGERMSGSFERAFAAGYRRAVIVGSDVPALRAAVLAEALEALREARVVLGPAEDGGYYLIGMRDSVADVFQGIAWGTDRVLSQTKARLAELGIEPHLLKSLPDVDRASDLPAAWRAELAPDRAPG